MRRAEHLTSREMRVLLRQALSEDPEASLLAQILRAVSDPAGPPDAKHRLHPFLLVLFLVAVFMAGVFFYFTLVSV